MFSTDVVVISWKRKQHMKYQRKILKKECLSRRKYWRSTIGVEYLAGKLKSSSQNIESKKKNGSVMRVREQTETEMAENLTFALG